MPRIGKRKGEDGKDNRGKEMTGQKRGGEKKGKITEEGK